MQQRHAIPADAVGNRFRKYTNHEEGESVLEGVHSSSRLVSWDRPVGGDPLLLL